MSYKSLVTLTGDELANEVSLIKSQLDKRWGNLFDCTMTDIKKMQAENKRMREALDKCKKQFEWYVQIHLENGHPDKAQRNQEYADLCSKALEGNNDKETKTTT